MPVPVSEVVRAYPEPTRAGVLALRGLIFDVAGRLGETAIYESLKWGQPAYRAARGTTLRLGPHREAAFALFAPCQSRVIADHATAFPGWDRLDGNRAVLFDNLHQIEPERLSHLIGHALTYRR
ncbi:MAG: DUF1801 domain-containing protein [Roseovarius sp.]